MFPSADEATADQDVFGMLFVVQVVPEFVEVKTGPPPVAAISLVPFAEEATESQNQVAFGTLFDSHASPEFVEVQTAGPSSGIATSIVPSADDAMQCQLALLGAMVCVQVWANEKFAAANPLQKTIAASNRGFICLMVTIKISGKVFDK